MYLKAWDEHDHHSVVLRETTDPGMDYMGWRVDSTTTLKKLAADLEGSGLASEMTWLPAAEKEKVGNGLPTTNPDAWPDGLRGMAPSRFDHCLLYGDDLDGSVRLFIDVLGFALTEQVVAGPEKLMIGAFLTCSTKPHDVAFIRQPVKGKFHHASFVLDNWGDVLKAADIIAKKNVPLDIGPTRHGITRGETVYFFDPSGNRNEVFSGGYIYYPDKPVLTWTDDELGKAIFYHDRKLNEKFLSVFT